MVEIKSLGDWMAARSLSLERLEETTGLDPKVLRSIVQGHYTPSPQQRRRLAEALRVDPGQIIWGHTQEVVHLYGHGPQFGRSP